MKYRKFAKYLISTGLVCLSSFHASAATIFSDTFDGNADPQWSEDSGTWNVASGVYRAETPSTVGPFRYSSLPFDLTDFSVNMDINGFFNSAIMLRSDFNGGAYNGVMLVTGGLGGGGNGIYWHIWQNGSLTGILNPSGNLFASQTDFSLRIDVSGDTYSAFVNGSNSAATTLTTSLFSSGEVALVQNNNDSFQSFDNVLISDDMAVATVPLSGTAPFLIFGLLGTFAYSSRKRSKRKIDDRQD